MSCFCPDHFGYSTITYNYSTHFNRNLVNKTMHFRGFNSLYLNWENIRSPSQGKFFHTHIPCFKKCGLYGLNTPSNLGGFEAGINGQSQLLEPYLPLITDNISNMNNIPPLNIWAGYINMYSIPSCLRSSLVTTGGPDMTRLRWLSTLSVCGQDYLWQ